MSSISKVIIGNMALGHVGARDAIESIDEESTVARQVRLWYDFSREQTLAAFDWSFARKRVALALIEEVPTGDPVAGEWSYRYQYPADCIAARYIVNPLGKTADAVPFEVEVSEGGEAKTILTDMEDPVLVYTFDQQLTSIFSPYFVQTLSILLGSHIAYPVTGKMKLKGELLNLFGSYIRAASAHDANERVSAPPREAENIRARNS